MILICIFAFLLGLVFGSFFNVLIYRLPRKESIAFPPSHCPSCNARIEWHDNIPLISYMILGGKCRKCKTGISIQYPLVELASAIIFTAVILRSGITLFALSYLTAFSFLLVISVIDLNTKEVNVFYLIPPAVLHVFALLFANSGPQTEAMAGMPVANMKDSLIGLLSGIVFIFLTRFLGGKILKREAMGEGDIYVAGLMGLLAGYKLFFYSVIFAGILGLCSYALLPSVRKGREIPFVPYLSAGLFLTYLKSDTIYRFFRL